MFWEKTIPPTRRLRLVEATNVIMNVRDPHQIGCYIFTNGVPQQRAPLKGKDLARITQPVLIIQVGLIFKYAFEHILMSIEGRKVTVVASEICGATGGELDQCPTN